MLNFLKYSNELDFMTSSLNFFNDGILLPSKLCLLVNILLYFEEAKYVLVYLFSISFILSSFVWTFNNKCVILFVHCDACMSVKCWKIITAKCTYKIVGICTNLWWTRTYLGWERCSFNYTDKLHVSYVNSTYFFLFGRLSNF